jgi:hypothetical protein
MASDNNLDNYSVLAEHPERGTVIGESFSTINAAIACAVELIQDGYDVEIFSASPLAPH